MLRNLEIVERAQGLFPKSSPVQLATLERIFSNIDTDKALDILEEAFIDHRFQTLPTPDLKRRAKACGLTGGMSGGYIDCWAVDVNGKYKMCSVLATNPEGAKVQMEKYLTNVCNVEPSFYTIFVENFKAFWVYRMRTMGIKSKVNTEVF